MPRIQSNGPTQAQNDYDDTDVMMDTAGRLRDGRMRGSMHEDRDAEIDARNTNRAESQDYTWKPPSNLDAPPARPGYVQRWVRAELRTEADNLNWQSKMREGWKPRDASTVPQSQSFYGTLFNGASVIRVGGLILCEAPESMVRAKRQYTRNIALNQERAITADVDKVSREGMRSGAAPIVREEEGQVTTGRRPSTMAN